MGFENRKGNRYYYRKKRVGRRVVSEYIGKGEYAGILARINRLSAEKKANDAVKSALARQKDDEIEQHLSELEEKTKLLVDSLLINKRFYKTKSREWRFKNDK
jgi:hypothetical protein